MNEYQQYALKVLSYLRSIPPGERVMWKPDLLACPGLFGGINLPDEEFCKGWAFRLAPNFAGALGISLATRYKDKKPYEVWIQSSSFDFKDGYTLHRADGLVAVQVRAATPASTNRDNKIRDPGYVRIRFFMWSQKLRKWARVHNKNISRIYFKNIDISEPLETTQEDFIKLLIVGDDFQS